MHLKRLSLTNFRNFSSFDREFPLGPTLLIGANAQGKTSLLEAIYYLAGAATPHTSSDRELIQFAALQETTPFARLVAEVDRGQRDHRIEIRLVIDSVEGQAQGRLRKEILVNGVKRRMSELARAINVVMFLPQDLGIAEGSPGRRRRFLDALISQSEPAYAEALTEYGKALSQRNALLKQMHGRISADQLEVWETQLAAHGSIILHRRSQALRDLNALAGPIHAELTRGRERLAVHYQPSFDPLPEKPSQTAGNPEDPIDRSEVSRQQAEQGLLEALKAARREEIRRGVTRLGPHRDDLRFHADGVDLHLYGSRGQNRTAVLAAKIAEVNWLRQQSGDWPILLLDEVLAELDADRRQDLLSRVNEVNQAVLTAADREMFTEEFCHQATLWRVTAGSVAPYQD